MFRFTNVLRTARFLLVFSLVIMLAGLTLSIAAPVSANSGAPKAQLWACTNGPATNPGDCTGVQGGTQTNGWSSNGNIQLNISHYVEGDVVPWRVEMTQLPANTTVQMVINYSFVNGAITWDYTAHWNTTVSSSSAGPCDGTVLAGCTMTSGSQYTFPIPPVLNKMVGGNATNYTCPLAPPGNQNMTIPSALRQMDAYGGINITNIVYNTPVPSCTLPKPSSDDSFTVTFDTPSQCTWDGNAMLLWGQHIGSQLDWGPGNTASSLGSGGTASPYHLSLSSWTFAPGTTGNPCPGQNLQTNGLNTQQIQMKVGAAPTAARLSSFSVVAAGTGDGLAQGTGVVITAMVAAGLLTWRLVRQKRTHAKLSP
jgi:hypothetical protein